MQTVQIRLAGFNGGTVPALRSVGRRALGTVAISRLLEEIRPQPPLFPADPARRRAVEEAEAWSERVLQPIRARAEPPRVVLPERLGVRLSGRRAGGVALGRRRHRVAVARGWSQTVRAR